MTFYATLSRLVEDEHQTVGRLSLFQGVHALFDCYTLELPFRDNAPFISCIPPGKYHCTRRFGEKFGAHWILKDVPGRSLILIHAGNFHRQTQGCILVGHDVAHIDKDGSLDVTRSFRTLATLFSIVDDIGFDLSITPVLKIKKRAG